MKVTLDVNPKALIVARIENSSSAGRLALANTPAFGYTTNSPYPQANTDLTWPLSPLALRGVYYYLRKKGIEIELTMDCKNWLIEAEDTRIKTQKILRNSVSLTGLYTHQATACRILNQPGKSFLLADEQGLGKTITALVANHNTIKSRRTLIVCPKFLCTNWVQEIRKWVGTKAHNLSDPSGRKKKLENLLAERQGQAITIVLNWDALTSLKTQLGGLKWDLVIGDEAHLIKNRKTNRFKAFMQVRRSCSRVLLLTGTPIEKSRGELWALLHAMYPKQYTSYWAFYSTFTDLAPAYFGGFSETGQKNTEIFLDLLAPIYIRRKRVDIPELNINEPQEFTISVEMNDKQINLHKDIARKETLYLPELDREIPNQISRLTMLRQISVDPSIVGFDCYGSKIPYLSELVDTWDEDILVFTTFRKAARLASEVLGKKAISYLAGDDPKIYQNWANYRDKTKVLISTPDSLGVGVNLQRAKYLVFLDIPWSSTKLKQAISRIVRIGQTQQPIIYYLSHNYPNSIDTLMQKLLEQKKNTFDQSVVTSYLLAKLFDEVYRGEYA